MTEVPCRIVTYDSILDEQEAIIEFNRQRVKTFTQKMAEGEKLKQIEAQRAKERQGMRTDIVPVLARSEMGKTRDKVSGSIGMSHGTYDKATKVWEAAKQGDETAAKLVERLDRGQTTVKRAAIEAIESAPVEGEYHVIVVDPPWQYEKRNEDPSHRGRCPYPTMAIEEICSLEIPSAPDCVLWLWTTNAFMHDAFHVLEAWGFQPKTILTWVKDRMGTGDWLRGQTEHCIMAIKGKPVVNLTNQTTVLHGPLREHSRKPDEFYSLVEALCPGQKLEMFARSERRGWAVHGNQLGRFPATA
jgi:N6-adenosine-specific RNA methylase IME4